jgi:hypothetical protein
LSHLIWSAKAILSAVSHLIWSVKAILSVGARSLAAVAVRAAGVDLLGVDQGGIEQNADRLGSVEFAGEGVQAGQQPVGRRTWIGRPIGGRPGPRLGSIGPKYSSTAEARKFRQSEARKVVKLTVILALRRPEALSWSRSRLQPPLQDGGSPDASAETVVRVILKVLAAAGEDRWT